ncbi:MAG TPA: carboxymuconolactone decarboxylase family protein [Solirubrobacterales bacterium]|nr:carboxymuconolactone decarboxylase family protein [Solirubrobacterales bacterium]
MSRIEPRQGAFASLMARGSRIAYGRELSSSRVYAHHPRLALDVMRYNRAAERGKRVPKALTELAVLKAATMVGCEFCIDIGSEYARRSGLSDEQLLALHEAHDSGLFSEDELMVIDLAVGMTRTPGEVGEELMARVRDRFGAKGALELVHMIAWENTRARVNIALDIGSDGFSEGRVCAVPDRDFAMAAPQP